MVSVVAGKHTVDNVWHDLKQTSLYRTNDGTQRFIVVPIAQSGAPQGEYQYAPNQTYPRNQNKANATSYVIPFPLSQVGLNMQHHKYRFSIACIMGDEHIQTWICLVSMPCLGFRV